MSDILPEVPQTSQRAKITAVLSSVGAVCGALVGVGLTYFGNVISGYGIPPTGTVYVWHASLFAIGGAIAGPTLVWNSIRNAPLWRGLVEPAAAGLVGAVLGFVTGSGVVFLLGSFGGIAAATLRLRRAYPDTERIAAGDEEDGRLEIPAETF